LKTLDLEVQIRTRDVPIGSNSEKCDQKPASDRVFRLMAIFRADESLPSKPFGCGKNHVFLFFKRRVKSHLLSASIIRSSLYAPR